MTAVAPPHEGNGSTGSSHACSDPRRSTHW